MTQKNKPDLRNTISFKSDSAVGCVYSVWNREHNLERRIIRTPNLDLALRTLEGLAGKAKYAYIYYSYRGELFFLCNTLDRKWSLQNYIIAVRLLKRRKTAFHYRQGLWSTKAALS